MQIRFKAAITLNEIIESIANTLLKRFNDIVTITEVIVFLAVIATLSMISLRV